MKTVERIRNNYKYGLEKTQLINEANKENEPRDIIMEKVEKKLIFKINEKTKKLENMVKNMLNIHDAQIENIIQMVSEMKEGNKNKNKQEKKILRFIPQMIMNTIKQCLTESSVSVSDSAENIS